MEHFKNVSLEDASKKSDEILTTYKRNLDEQFEKHKREYAENSKVIEEAKISEAKLEAKRALAKAQAEIKREVSNHHNEIKNYVFSEVNKKIEAYKKTSEYKTMLISQITSIKKQFDGEDIVFLIDESDKGLLDTLSKETSVNIEVSKTSFVGGTKAIIEARNILVDNSFKTKLSEEQDHFTISL
ncbi:MAG: V-type ATP synthase subunit E [Lachnospiraceae bacterium]|nr:V-type ATP synthase subunit E [Lachnospiraceae bacterium]